MEYEYIYPLVKFIHVVVGVIWIGLLYYFNFVQVPALKEANADGTAAGITKHVAPLALLWFRWAALATWIAGAALIGWKFCFSVYSFKWIPRNWFRRMVRYYYVIQCMGTYLAKPTKNSWFKTCKRCRKNFC